MAALKPNVESRFTTTADKLQSGDWFDMDRKHANGHEGPYLCTTTQIPATPKGWKQVMDTTGIQHILYTPEAVPIIPVEPPKVRLQDIAIAHLSANSGADPEIFVQDEAGALIPAFRFLKPQPPAAPIKAYAEPVYYDGFQVEFGTQPSHCHAYVADYLRSGLLRTLAEARKFNPKATLVPSPVVPVSADMLQTLEPEFVALGCDPSENAYGAEPVVVPDARALTFRFAGGHIHFGVMATDEEKRKMVQWMDVFAAIPGVAMFENLDDPIRRQFYGRAGEYRNKPYGLEYRTLSNAWLYSPESFHVMWNLARIGTGTGKAFGSVEGLGLDATRVQAIINETDVKAARAFVAENKGMYLALARRCWGRLAAYNQIDTDANASKAFFKAVEGGIESVLPNIKSIEKNWMLDSTAWATHSNGDRATWEKLSKRVAGLM